MKRFWIWLFAAGLCLFCLGCGQPKEGGGEGSQRTITDAVGNEVTLPAKPQRIVSMTLGTDELLMDLVPTDRIAALTYLSDDSGISHISERSGAVEHKIRGTSAEAILALHPDLILIGDWWKLEFLATFRDMGIPVYVYKTPYTVDDVEKMIVEVAGAVGEEERGQALREEYHRRIEKVQRMAAREKQCSVLAIAGAGGAAYGTKGSMYDDMCRYAGIYNVLRDITANGNTRVSKEIIIEKNPDVILLPAWTTAGMEDVPSREELLSDPALATVEAIREGRIVSVSGRTLYCVSHYVADGIEELATAVYPKAFLREGTS